MSWGTKVIIILVVFVTGMLSMVYLSMQQTNEVIDTDYYEREMKYQSVIDGKKNLQRLQDTVSIKNNGQQVQIKFPEASVTNLDSGKIEFMKFSTSRGDRSIEMKAGKGSLYEMPVASFVKGWYKVRMEWSNQGISYYHEQDFNIQ